MKKIQVLILLLFSAALTYAQEGIITYEVRNNKDKVKNYFTKGRDTLQDKYLKKTIDDIYGSSVSIKVNLSFSQKGSIYKVEKKLQNERDNNLGFKLIRSIAGGDNIYYSNPRVNQIQDCTLLGECFLINMPKVEWKLTQEKKKIGNHNCFLAKATYKTYLSTISIEAWYTPDIPISYAPMNLNGLPGLVIELKTNKAQFIATNILLNPKDKVKIKQPKNGKEVSNYEFEDILKKSFPEFYKRLASKKKTK
jgi:GLPGLI family protein